MYTHLVKTIFSLSNSVGNVSSQIENLNGTQTTLTPMFLFRNYISTLVNHLNISCILKGGFRLLFFFKSKDSIQYANTIPGDVSGWMRYIYISWIGYRIRNYRQISHKVGENTSHSVGIFLYDHYIVFDVSTLDLYPYKTCLFMIKTLKMSLIISPAQY